MDLGFKNSVNIPVIVQVFDEGTFKYLTESRLIRLVDFIKERRILTRKEILQKAPSFKVTLFPD